MTNPKPSKAAKKGAHKRAGAAHEPMVDRAPHSLTHGRRIFDINLLDRVDGVWDDSIPIVEQCTAECVGVARDQLSSYPVMDQLCERICKDFKLSVLDSYKQRLEPGLTMVLLLSESHLALHTWPEKGYIHIDLVTCDKRGVNPRLLSDLLVEVLHPKSVRVTKIYY